jgi:Domain of unknown function (DUF1906)
MREGVDYAFTPHPSTASLKKAGKTFVLRYFAGGAGGSKELTASEAKELSTAGLDIGVVWETSAGRAGRGGLAGATDARKAKAQAEAVGMPADRPIYFAVDYDANPTPGSGVDRYFRAVANVLGVERTGVYGGYKVVKFLFDQKRIKYGWQTYAWTAGRASGSVCAGTCETASVWGLRVILLPGCFPFHAHTTSAHRRPAALDVGAG